MSVNDESSSRYFGDNSQLTNLILDSVAMCHMTPEFSIFIPLLLEDTDKYIEVTDGNHVTEQQKRQAQIKMCDGNGDTFIATLHNVLLALDICNRLFLVIKLINSGHTCLFYKLFCTVYFGDKRKMRLLYHIVHSLNIHFGEK